jgi:anti-sigma B factor antagonist
VNPGNFELTTARHSCADGTEIPVAQLRGDIDVTNAARLGQDLADLATDGLVVDLSRISYFDSAGFAVLDRLLSQHAMAVVIMPASVVRTAMTLMGLPFHDSVDDAVAALRPG